MQHSGVIAGRYELHEIVGQGGMADVYKATDTVLSRQVAVKLLRDSAGDETDRLRFTAEARTLAGLNHRALVTVLDAGVDAQQPFLVMELVEGPTLAQVCATGPLDPTRVATIGAILADGVAYAHAQGVIHRDVKPGNVLLGTRDRLKLADFGIARLIGDTMRHTRTGHTIGTAAYLAPEQVRGQELPAAADVYSLGLVLLEALTGERAYTGTPTEAALARLSTPPPVPEDVPNQWRELIGAMTALEPADRPSAHAVALRLQRLGEEPLGSVAHPDDSTTSTGAVVPTRTHGVGDTRLLPQPHGATPRARPWADRARDLIRRQPQAVSARIRAMDADQRGAAVVMTTIVLFVLLVALIGQTTPSGTQGPPPETPAELRQPLQDLHDAVSGR